jgi:proline iminopeptidase
MPFDLLRVKTPGAALAVRHYAGAGEPIILLHGGPGMGDYFETLAAMMSPPHRVVSYDQRGCGTSVGDGAFDIEAQIADLEAIRSYLGAHRIHLFGHSWGGLLGQLYAKAHRDRVASLVLCCSMSSTGRDVAQLESKWIETRVIGQPKRSMLKWVTAGALMQLPGKLGDLGFGLALKQLLPHYVLRPEHAPKPFYVSRVSQRAWRGTNRAIKKLSEDCLSRVSLDAPVMIVQGEQDVIRETNPILAARFPTAENIRIPNAVHFPWVEQPDVFANAVLGFYRRTGAASSRGPSVPRQSV